MKKLKTPHTEDCLCPNRPQPSEATRPTGVTPTPWKAINDQVREGIDSMPALIAKTAGETDVEAFANAAFIVRAVNAYKLNEEIKKELFEALIHLNATLEDILKGDFRYIKQARLHAKLAIAKAEGK